MIRTFTDAAAVAVRLLEPERAHRATIALLKTFGPLLPGPPKDDARLSVRALGLDFSNPIGLAAGFDKDAEVPDAMLALGLGFTECGTVTPRPQAGNPRPRLFRLTQDCAVVNRMGFNNAGMEDAAGRLARRGRGIVGVNIGANKDSADRIADYGAALARLAPLADYVAVNVSSPNTPGLRGLQDRETLTALLARLAEEHVKLARRVPLLLKIAPDLDGQAMDDVAQVAIDSGLAGLIVSNTTIARPPSLKSPSAKEQGGLSGKPLFALSTEILKGMRRRVGTKLVLIGVGGVSSGADAYAKIRAGASLVQLYTALAYEGPWLVARIKRELLACLDRDGIKSVTEAIGVDAESA